MLRTNRPLAAAISAVALALAACSSSAGSGASDAGAGCPSSPPPEGNACFLPNDTTCSYGGAPGPCGGGGGEVVVCSNGTWSYEATAGSGTPVAFACPTTIPQQGSACSIPPCSGVQPSCSYGCDQGGPASATCNGSTWQVQQLGIACSTDAGIDVNPTASCYQASACGSVEYCEAPGGPYLTGFALGQPCTSDAICSPDAGMPLCNGHGCVCQSTEYSPRPLAGQQGPGFCMAPCATDGDCANPLYGDGTGFACGAGGHCVPKSCSAPGDCPGSFDCAAQQCVRRSCTSDGDCVPPGACVNGACYPTTGTCQGLPA
jgi:hypothetical protein